MGEIGSSCIALVAWQRRGDVGKEIKSSMRVNDVMKSCCGVCGEEQGEEMGAGRKDDGNEEDKYVTSWSSPEGCLTSAGLCSDQQPPSLLVMETLKAADLCIPLNTSRRSMPVTPRSMVIKTLLSCISVLTVVLNLLVIISISHFRHWHFSWNMMDNVYYMLFCVILC